LEVLEPTAIATSAVTAYPPDSVEQALRACAVSVLDVADVLAESAASLGAGIVERLRKPPTPVEVEEGEIPTELPEAEAEVVEEEEETDSASDD